MAADDLVTQGAQASVAIVMTHFSRIFWFQHHQGLSQNSTQIIVMKKKGILSGHQRIDVNGSEQNCKVSYDKASGVWDRLIQAEAWVSFFGDVAKGQRCHN